MSVLFIILSILGFIFICLIFLKKIKVDGPISAYILVTLLPIIVIVGLTMIIVSALSLLLKPLPIAIWLMIIEIFIISIFIFIKININDATWLKEKESVSVSVSEDRNIKLLKSGKRLVEYAIYANLVYGIPTILSIVYIIIKNNETVGYFLLHPQELLSAVISLLLACILVPMGLAFLYIGSFISIIVVVTTAILVCSTTILSINGLIRILYASKALRTNSLKCIFSVFIPILNVIFMYKLCGFVKKELKRLNNNVV